MGCRRRGSRSDLLRVVAIDGGEGRTTRAVVDVRRAEPGRGAWLHPDPQCLDLAERRRAFPRALRTGPIDTAPVRDHLGRTTKAAVTQESGLEADGPPMSTLR